MAVDELDNILRASDITYIDRTGWGLFWHLAF